MSRRWLLGWLLGLASLAWADGKDKDKKGSNDKDKDKEEKEYKNSHRTLYTEVSLAHDRTVATRAGQLSTDSPWAPFLAPGMWLRAEGVWQEKTFVADGLEIIQPTRFSYFRGPAHLLGLSGGWVEAWYTFDGATTRRFALRQTIPGQAEVRLLAYAGPEGWVALPPSLPAPPSAGQGWWLVEGRLQGPSLIWKTPRRFP